MSTQKLAKNLTVQIFKRFFQDTGVASISRSPAGSFPTQKLINYLQSSYCIESEFPHTFNLDYHTDILSIFLYYKNDKPAGHIQLKDDGIWLATFMKMGQ